MPAAIDIGNTFIKAGFFDGETLTGAERFSHDQMNLLVNRLKGTSCCNISSVVPESAAKLASMLAVEGIETALITRNSSFILTVEYSTPETLGIDRLCGAEGAFRLLKSEGKEFGAKDFIISIDAGTATTINIVKHPGVFTGGIIAPGIRMMFGALNKNTSQLPGVDTGEYKDLIGDSTASSIASGVINATAGLIDRAVTHLRTKSNSERIYIYITGGNASNIIPFLNFEFTHEPNLVLHGINSVYLNGISRKG